MHLPSPLTVSLVFLGMNCFRMIRGFVEHANSPGGAVGYLGALAPWDHVFKDTLYATQEILGDGVAVSRLHVLPFAWSLIVILRIFQIYRCWVIWSRDFRVILVPSALFIVQLGKTPFPVSWSALQRSNPTVPPCLVSGYAVCGLYPSEKAGSTVFDPRLTRFIIIFYATAVVQSSLTTGLMAYRIWQTDRRSAAYRADRGNLMPILRILIESASLQLVVELILLILYSINYNAQYILLEIVTPLVVRFSGPVHRVIFF